MTSKMCRVFARKEIARRPSYGSAGAARAAPNHVARDTSILNFSSGLRRAYSRDASTPASRGKWLQRSAIKQASNPPTSQVP